MRSRRSASALRPARFSLSLVSYIDKLRDGWRVITALAYSSPFHIHIDQAGRRAPRIRPTAHRQATDLPQTATGGGVDHTYLVASQTAVLSQEYSAAGLDVSSPAPKRPAALRRRVAGCPDSCRRAAPRRLLPCRRSLRSPPGRQSRPGSAAPARGGPNSRAARG